MTEVPVHELKILPEYFDAVRCGDKRFEIRKNDRNFHSGDILRLKEWDGEKYTGEEIDVLVRYILYEWTGGLQLGYCIMSIDTMMHYSPRKAELIKIPLITNGQEVIRCKDCKHYNLSGKYCAYDPAWEKNKRHQFGIACEPEWFCADGKRSE